jgi:hypothetical protein
MRSRHLPLRTSSLAFVAALALGGCSYGVGGGYGFGGLSLGVSTGGGYYDNALYSSYSGNPYWGWYDGFYYPGTGFYIYDINRRPYRWTSTQQSYWTGRHSYWRSRGDRREFRSNWNDFSRNGAQRTGRTRKR